MAKNANDININFYKPQKRFVIPINEFHIPKKLFSSFKRSAFKFKINSNFIKVIENCANINKKRNDTWINTIIKNSYINLYNYGYAKSLECYENNELIGGLYGVHIGKCFFGESMFNIKSNTSKYCLLFLISILIDNKYTLLDSQFFNQHLLQFGAYEITDEEYQLKPKKAVLSINKFPKSLTFQKSLSILQSLSHKS